MAKMMRKMMKKSMKSRKMKKVAKKSRKMKKRVSKVAKGKRAKNSVFKGTKEKTSGGLKKSDLKRNKRGKIVSAKASRRSANSKGGKVIIAWGKATKRARVALGIKGFCPVGGKT